MLDFLPEKLKKALSFCNLQKVYELRIRADKPITILYEENYVYLGERGATRIKNNAIRCTQSEIIDSAYRAGNCSIYAVEEEIRRGFITSKDGERIGLAGDYVFNKGEAYTIRDFTSICIRVPHIVRNCGQTLYNICMSDRVNNMFLLSPPGMGKTTLLRDLGRILSEKTNKNILLCDERGELSIGENGETCDIIKFADKQTVFEAGIRAMRPDVIITDEISEIDCKAVKRAISAGIAVIASGHFYAMQHIRDPFFPLFDRYVFLNRERIGEIDAVYNEKGIKIYDCR